MNLERVGVGLLAGLSAVLIGWNLKLQSDLNSFAPELVSDVEASSSMTGVQEAPGTEKREVIPRQRAGRVDMPIQDRTAARSDKEEAAVDEEAKPSDGSRRRRMDWDAIRSEMESDTVEIVESFSATQKWDPKVADEVIAILLDTSDEISQLWTDARSDGSDDRSRYQIHKDMEDIRNVAAEEIGDLVGQETYDALAEELFEARHETFRRRHDG